MKQNFKKQIKQMFEKVKKVFSIQHYFSKIESAFKIQIIENRGTTSRDDKSEILQKTK